MEGRALPEVQFYPDGDAQGGFLEHCPSTPLFSAVPQKTEKPVQPGSVPRTQGVDNHPNLSQRGIRLPEGLRRAAGMGMGRGVRMKCSGELRCDSLEKRWSKTAASLVDRDSSCEGRVVRVSSARPRVPWEGIGASFPLLAALWGVGR